MTHPTPRVFPVPRPFATALDERFTIGLVIDVRDVLVTHGYPEATGSGDLVALQLALFRFIYGDGDPR